MSKKLVVILVSIMSSTCSSQKLGIHMENEIYEIINLELNNNKSINLYFKSFVSEKYNADYIRINESGYNCTVDVVNPNLIRHKLDSVDHISSFSKKKRDSLKIILVKKYKIQEEWKSLPQIETEQLSKNYINRSIKWDRTKVENHKMRITKKNWNRKFSIPVFNNDKTLAMMFIEYPDSFSSHFYIKKNGKWYSYCSSIIELGN